MTIVVFILVLGILVFVHEFGHFIVAKWCGVRVEKFSLGFGPVIFKKRIGETQYQVACVPLGGYVKMSGEDPTEEIEEDPKDAKKKKKEEEEEEEEILPPVGPERMFNTQPIPKRLAIVISGPLMNILMALILVPLVYMIGIEVDSSLYQKAIVGFVDADGPAAKAGIKVGDEIVRINDKAMPDWKKVKTFILFHPNRDLTLDIKRGADLQVVHIKSDTLASLGGGTIGVYPEWASKILRVMPDKPAAAAGFKDGDLIIELDGIKNPHWFETQNRIQKSAGKPLSVTVDRGTGPVQLTVTPEARAEAPELGFIGIEPVQPSEMRRFGMVDAVVLGLQENLENTVTTFVVVGKLFTGGLKIKAVGGPVQIAEFTGAAAQEGFTHLLLFMAFISLQLAILNLLPIPVLDGGHVAFMLVEAIKGSPLSLKTRLLSQQIGMVLLISLMVVVTFNDVARHKGTIFGFFKHFIP